MARIEDTNARLFLDDYAKTRSIADRNRVVEQYMYIAQIAAKRFSGRGVEYEDLCQVGYLALIKAVERFDIAQGYSFSAYATPSVVGEIKNYFRDKLRSIRLPRRFAEIYGRISAYRDAFYAQHGYYPNAAQTGAALGLDADIIVEAIESHSYVNAVSIEELRRDEDDADVEIKTQDNGFENVEIRDFIEREMNAISELERSILRARFWDGKTQTEVARELNVSQMYVSRTERRLLGKMRMNY